MATTWLKALHRTNSGSISAAINRTLEYAGNPEKTMGGELIAAYECHPITAESEFLLSKKLYEQKTGRNQGQRDVIGYQIRQSFKPGEVTPEEALEIGYELALRWTKGKHQFIVAAHTNTDNPHTHIFYNSVTLDHSRKFADFKRSAIALRRVSDKLCIEHGLSIVENPKLSKGYNRTEYLGGRNPPTGRDMLRMLIDKSLLCGMEYDNFIAAMVEAGCEVKQGKYLAFKLPEGKKFIRCKSLGDDYMEDAILERISGKRVVAVKKNPSAFYNKKAEPVKDKNTPVLLIDIQAKLQEGKGRGYEKWATGFNIRQMSKTLLFLKDNGVGSYEELAEKSAAVSAEFNGRLEKIKVTEKRLKEISDLQKHIGTYGKTLDVYKKYLASGKDTDFYESNRADIALHMAAKKHFDSLKLKKLPAIQDLKKEYAELAAEKKKLYAGYHELKDTKAKLLTAKHNAEKILGITPDAQNPDASHEQNRGKFHGR